VGGRQEVLCLADTDDPTAAFDTAVILYGQRLKVLQSTIAQPVAVVPSLRLGPMFEAHLVMKARAKRTKASTIGRDATSARVLIGFFQNCGLKEITVSRLQEYMEKRRQDPGARRGTLVSESTIRTELLALSNMFRYAHSLNREIVNPVEQCMYIPSGKHPRAECLTREEAARLLDAAAEYDRLVRVCGKTGVPVDVHSGFERTSFILNPDAFDAPRDSCAKRQGRFQQWEKRLGCMEAILTTFLYSGGRLKEVLGLRVKDIDFERYLIQFTPNQFRGLKNNETHRRILPLYPALATILRRHVLMNDLADESLLFTRSCTPGKMIGQLNAPFAQCCRAASIDSKRYVTRHTLRHTYATTLMYTARVNEVGALIQRSDFDVANHLGHSSAKMVAETYAHPHPTELRAEFGYEDLRQLPALRFATAAETATSTS
jgi:integrase